MRLKLKYPIAVMPDKDGEYPEAIGKILVASGYATIETASCESHNERRGRPKKNVR